MLKRSGFLLFSLLLISVGLKSFVEITDDYYENDLNGLDRFASDLLRNYQTSGLTIIMRVITHLGDNITYILSILALLFLMRRSNYTRTILQLLGVIALSFLISYGLKEIIGRPRPDGEKLVNVYTKSYPSGHSISAATFYLLAIYMIIRNGMRYKAILISISIIMILLIGISRIYLGVHYASDVLAGFSVGFFISGTTIFIYEIFRYYLKKKMLLH